MDGFCVNQALPLGSEQALSPKVLDGYVIGPALGDSGILLNR